MAFNKNAWLARARSLPDADLYMYREQAELTSGTISLATMLYGAASPQLSAIRSQLGEKPMFAGAIARGIVENMIAEVEAGMHQNVRLEVAGELLGDLIFAAKEARKDGRKEVAAVLSAILFEDCMRRLDREKLGSSDRPKLESVLSRLKDGGVLRGGEPSLLQGYLKFRNDALHADFEKVEDTQIDTCISLMEGIISKHFS